MTLFLYLWILLLFLEDAPPEAQSALYDLFFFVGWVVITAGTTLVSFDRKE